MRLLYGVVGEGMGHAIRSRVVIEHLLESGHEVEIMASSRAADFLARRFSDVHRIHGYHVIYDDNRVRRGRTLWWNVSRGIAALPRQLAAYYEVLEDFEPEAVISDFESWTYLFAKRRRLPILSVDNIQMINRCRHPPEILAGVRADFEVARAFVKSKLPACDHYLIATFFHPPVRKEDTTLLPPILRPEILEAGTERGEHLLVYQTAEGNRTLLDALHRSGMECRAYGLDRSLTEERVVGNVRMRPFDERTFIEDLATSRGVVAGGGFTLMGECVYLRKPLLSVPVRGQFEQALNARYLEREGYGRAARLVDDATLRDFLDGLPACEEALERYEQDGNRLTMEAIDQWLERR